MLRNPAVQYSIIGLAVVVVLAVACWWLFSGKRHEPPDTLADRALSGADRDEREEAAARLSEHPNLPVEHLRRVAEEGDTPQVRAAATLGLGRARDWESMPLLIEALESDSELERGRAASAINRIVGQDFGYRARDPVEKRREAIELIKLKWPRLYEGYKAKQKKLGKE